MNSENQIVTKITADIAGLKQGVAEAKQSLESFKTTSENFKVNWDGGTGSIEEYNESLKKSVIEWGEYQKQQEIAAQLAQENTKSTEENSQATEELAESQNVLSFAIEKVKDAFSSMKQTASENLDSIKTAFGNVKDAAEGYALRMNEATKSNGLLHTTTRTAKAGVVALSAAVTAYAKSSLDEYAKANSDFAATQERVSGAMQQLKLSFGAVLASLYPLVDGIAQWLVQNKELVTTLVTAAAGIAAAGLAVKAFGVAVATAKALTSGWIGVLSLLAGVAAAAYASTIDFSSGISDNSAKIAELQGEIAEIDSQLASANKTVSGAGSNARKEIEKTRKQLEDLNFEYNQSLKQIAVNHEKTLQDLTRQIEEENVQYNKAIEERRAKFKSEQLEEEKEHQDKVDELTKQINFLQKKNNKYNKEKLAQLKYALNEENRLYQLRTEAEQEELDAQIEAEQAAHDSKLASVQAELDDELAFQEKHREALQGVRDVILLDEIESLQRQHEAQITSYNEQLADALSYGSAAGNNYSQGQIDALEAKKADIQSKIDELTEDNGSAYTNGKNTGNSFGDGAIAGFWEHLKKGGIVADIWKWLLGDERYERWTTQGIKTGWATGGYTGYGAPDEIAGVVHKGEYVLRADQVDQSTGLPKSIGNNVTINVSGTFATSASERRKVAQQIASALEQVQKARLIN